MTNEIKVAEYMRSNETTIQTLIESRLMQKVIDEFIYNIDDTITDEIPFPDFDIDENENDEIAADIRDQITNRIIKTYFKNYFTE